MKKHYFSSVICFFLLFSVLNAQTAYLANNLSDDVSVVDLNTATVVATIAVGQSPLAVAINSSTRKVYVANRASSTVSVIDVNTNTVESTISLGEDPSGVALSPDGATLYVTNQSDNNVTVINTADNSTITLVSTGINPFGIAVSPDGSVVYVSNRESNSITVIEAASNTGIATIPVDEGPQGIVFNATGTKAFVANASGDVVSVIDVATNTLSNTIPTTNFPRSLAIGGPNNDKLYATNDTGGTVDVIDLATETVESTIDIATGMTAISTTNDGTTIYAANRMTNLLYTIDAATNTVTGSIALGSAPISYGNFLLEELPGERCDIAIDINALTGQAEMIPQVSELYDNLGYDTDPTDPLPSCVGLINNTSTIWFTFTGDGNRYTINSINNDNPSIEIIAALFSGQCEFLVEEACSFTIGEPNFSIDIQTEPGVEYTLMVFSDSFTETNAFNIEVTNQGTVDVTHIVDTDLRIFPNPTTGWVQLPQIESERVEVYDATGRLVFQQIAPTTDLDLSAQPAGLYLLKLYNGEAAYSARVVKK